MPELPEVETMRRGLFGCIGGVITSVIQPKIPYRPIQIEPKLPQLRRRVIGKRIEKIDRIAKRVLVRLDSGDAIVLQPKMAGLAMVTKPPSPQHVRLIFELRSAPAEHFLYWDRRGLGCVTLWSSKEVEEKLGPNQIGPDASLVDERTFAERFGPLRRSIKVAMLDQRVTSGIGNLYAAEILHAAKVHPMTRCDTIDQRTWKRVHQATIRILNEAIEKEGSTLSDGSYQSALSDQASYQAEHLVYDREGERCLSCGKGVVQRMVQSQRSTFFCPLCQRFKGP